MINQKNWKKSRKHYLDRLHVSEARGHQTSPKNVFHLPEDPPTIWIISTKISNFLKLEATKHLHKRQPDPHFKVESSELNNFGVFPF